MMKFGEIQDSFMFVSSDAFGIYSAVLDKRTGRTYCRSEVGDLDEISDADIDWDSFITIPYRNDLDLGRELVYDFDPQHLPEELDPVFDMLHRPGSYGRFKDLLHSKRLLEAWSQFEALDEDRVFRNTPRLFRR